LQFVYYFYCEFKKLKFIAEKNAKNFIYFIICVFVFCRGKIIEKNFFVVEILKGGGGHRGYQVAV
jgi:hypothetical protein